MTPKMLLWGLLVPMSENRGENDLNIQILDMKTFGLFMQILKNGSDDAPGDLLMADANVAVYPEPTLGA